MTFSYMLSVLLVAVFVLINGFIMAQEVIQKYQDFTSDPDWEGKANRIDLSIIKTVVQDFGYSHINYAGGYCPEEIGDRFQISESCYLCQSYTHKNPRGWINGIRKIRCYKRQKGTKGRILC